MIQTLDVSDSPLSPSPVATGIGHPAVGPARRQLGCVQAHVVILPAALAEDFRDFCVRNPQGCPLLATTQPGQAMLPSLGDDIDIRADLPVYQVWRDGELQVAAGNLVPIWRRDLVSFVFAAGFSFEQVLPPRASSPRIEESVIPTLEVGPFGGPLLVEMRPLAAQQVIRAINVGIRLGEAHGLPVHLGDPGVIGLRPAAAPHAAGELPAFFASALTALAAARRAQAPLCITSAPGSLLSTDLPLRPVAM